MAICVVVTVAFIVLSMQESLLFTVLLLGCAGIMLAGPMWWINWSDRKARRKRYESSLIGRNGILRERVIELRFDKARSELQWDLFDKWFESHDLMIVAHGREYQAFAPYMFASQEDWESCKQMIGEKREEIQSQV